MTVWFYSSERVSQKHKGFFSQDVWIMSEFVTTIMLISFGSRPPDDIITFIMSCEANIRSFARAGDLAVCLCAGETLNVQERKTVLESRRYDCAWERETGCVGSGQCKRARLRWGVTCGGGVMCFVFHHCDSDASSWRQTHRVEERNTRALYHEYSCSLTRLCWRSFHTYFWGRVWTAEIRDWLEHQQETLKETDTHKHTMLDVCDIGVYELTSFRCGRETGRRRVTCQGVRHRRFWRSFGLQR